MSAPSPARHLAHRSSPRPECLRLLREFTFADHRYSSLDNEPGAWFADRVVAQRHRLSPR